MRPIVKIEKLVVLLIDFRRFNYKRLFLLHLAVDREVGDSFLMDCSFFKEMNRIEPLLVVDEDDVLA